MTEVPRGIGIDERRIAEGTSPLPGNSVEVWKRWRATSSRILPSPGAFPAQVNELSRRATGLRLMALGGVREETR